MSALETPGWLMLPSSPNWYCSSVSAWSAQGTVAIACRNSVALLQVQSKRFTGELTGHTGRISAIQFVNHSILAQQRQQILVSGSADHSVRVWDLATNTTIGVHRHPTDVTALATSSLTSTLVLSGDKQGRVLAWHFSFSGAPTNEICSTTFDSPVTALVCSPKDPNVAVVGLQSGRVLVMNVTSAVTRELAGHEDQIQSLSWSPDQKLVASSSRDRVVKVWNVQSSEQHTAFRIKRKPAGEEEEKAWISVAWLTASKLVSSALNGHLLVWTVAPEPGEDPSATAVTLQSPQGHTRLIFSITPNPSHFHLVLTTSLDRNICFWDTRKNKLLWRIPSLGGHVFACESPSWQRNILGIGCGDKTLRLWNTELKGDPYSSQTVWKGIQAQVHALSFHPSEEGVLAFGTENGRIGVYHTQKMTQKREFTPHQGPVLDLGWRKSRTGAEMLYSLGADGVLLQANPLRPRDNSVTLRRARQDDPRPTAFAWKPDGTLLAMGHADGSVDIFSAYDDPAQHAPRLTVLRKLREQTRTIHGLRWNPHQDYSRQRTPLASDSAPLQYHHYWLAAASEDCTVVVYDCTGFSSALAMSPVAELPSEPASGTSQAVAQNLPPSTSLESSSSNSVSSPSSSSSASSSSTSSTSSAPQEASDGEAPEPSVFVPGKGTLCVLRGHKGPVRSVCWSPHDAALLLSTSFDCSAQVWDVTTAKPTVNLRGHEGRVLCASWSRIRANIVFTGSEDQTCRQWDVSQSSFSQPPSTQETRKKRLLPRPQVDNPKPESKSEPRSQPRPVPRPANVESTQVPAPKALLAPSIFDLSQGAASSLQMARGEGASLLDSCLFGTKDIGELLDADSGAFKPNLEVWQGRLPRVCQERIGNLNPHWVALSAAAGRDVWASMCGHFAQQLAAAGDTHTAVLYLVVSGAIRPAIELYLKAGLFAEALALAKARLLDGDELISRVYLQWAHVAEGKGQIDLAAKCFLGAGQGSRAVAVLLRSGGAAHELASAIQDPSAPSLARQRAEQLQAAEEWEQARALYAQFEELRPLLLLCHAEEVLGTHLLLSSTPQGESGTIPLVSLVLQSWMLADCMPSTDARELADSLAGLDQRHLASKKRTVRVRGVAALKVTRACLMGLSGEPSSHLLAECAEVLYQHQMYPALERFGALVSFPRLSDLGVQGHSSLLAFGLWTVLLLWWAGRPAPEVAPEDMLLLLSPPHARLSVCSFQSRVLEEEQQAIAQQLQGLSLSLKDFIRVNKVLKQKAHRQRQGGQATEIPAELEEEEDEAKEPQENAYEVRQRAKRQARQLETRFEACKAEMAALVHEIRVILSKELIRPFPCPFLSTCLLLEVFTTSPSLKAPIGFVDRLWAWGVDNACTPLREHFEKREIPLTQVIVQNGLVLQRLQKFRKSSDPA